MHLWTSLTKVKNSVAADPLVVDLLVADAVDSAMAETVDDHQCSRQPAANAVGTANSHSAQLVKDQYFAVPVLKNKVAAMTDQTNFQPPKDGNALALKTSRCMTRSAANAEPTAKCLSDQFQERKYFVKIVLKKAVKALQTILNNSNNSTKN